MTDLQDQARESVVVEQSDRDAASEAFDIAFRGETDGIDAAMADLFARHRADEVEQLREALESIATWPDAAMSDPSCALHIRDTAIVALARAKGGQS